jgi:hypothetical protein
MRMQWKVGLVAWCVLSAVALGVMPRPSEAGERHAGTVLSVDMTRRLLMLNEIGANAVRRTQAIRLSPEITMLRSERDVFATDFDRLYPAVPMSLSELRPGDFVVIEMGGTRGEATTLVVTLQAGS